MILKLGGIGAAAVLSLPALWRWPASGQAARTCYMWCAQACACDFVAPSSVGCGCLPLVQLCSWEDCQGHEQAGHWVPILAACANVLHDVLEATVVVCREGEQQPAVMATVVPPHLHVQNCHAHGWTTTDTAAAHEHSRRSKHARLGNVTPNYMQCHSLSCQPQHPQAHTQLTELAALLVENTWDTNTPFKDVHTSTECTLQAKTYKCGTASPMMMHPTGYHQPLNQHHNLALDTSSCRRTPITRVWRLRRCCAPSTTNTMQPPSLADTAATQPKSLQQA